MHKNIKVIKIIKNKTLPFVKTKDWNVLKVIM